MTRVREMPRAGVGPRDAGPAEPKLDGAGPTGRTGDQVVVSEPDVLLDDEPYPASGPPGPRINGWPGRTGPV